MPEVEIEAGMFNWVDLMSTDCASAKGFYSALLGWEHVDIPAGDGVYTMFKKAGRQVAGMGASLPGHPATWNSYVLVEDLDVATNKAKKLGGTIVMEPMDVMTAGRMSIIQDPTGAFLSLWQAGDHKGAQLFNEHGTHTWNELMTRDVATAQGFYGELLQWSYEEMDMGEAGVYHLVQLNGRDIGGIMAMDGNWPAEIPPHWGVYFAADDVDALVSAVVPLGGSVAVPPMDISVGRFASLVDPTGATFTVFKSASGE